MSDLKPQLVDYNLIQFPVKQITPIQQKIATQDNSKFYFNLLMIIILLIGGLVLYYRNKNKEELLTEYENKLINQYQNEFINMNKDVSEY